MTAKFKQVRTGMRQWRKGFHNFNKVLHNSDWVLLLLDGLEEQSPLSNLEAAQRKLVKKHIAKLLEQKKIILETKKYCKVGQIRR